MMMRLMLPAALLISFGCLSQEKFQLAPPMLKYNSAFFTGETKCSIDFNQPGAVIRYSLDGKDPDESSTLYQQPITINKRTVLKVKAFGKDYLPSETVTATFINDGKRLVKASFSPPNESYASANADILIDNTGGIINYRSGTWIGFDSDTVTVDIELSKKENINTVLISMLQDENSWIFLPEQIDLFYFDDGNNKFIRAGRQSFTHEVPGSKTCRITEFQTGKNITANRLQLVFVTLRKIPGWHGGRGRHGWLFIDEIKVY